MLEFFDDKKDSGYATLYDRHIVFNSKLIKFFDDAYRVRVAVDKETRKLYVFMVNKDYALSGEVNESSLLPISVSKSYVRISSKSLINFISNSCKVSPTKENSIQCKAIYEDLKKAIVVDLDGE